METEFGSSSMANPDVSAKSRTTRPRKKAKIDQTASVTTGAPGGTTVTQPRKRTKGKGKTGALEGLMSIPMDVLFEIFCHLRPLDILQLSRTTKEFRRILIHTSSKFIWKAARLNVNNLPDPFPGMNEIEFINLAFSTYCHVCLAPNVRSVDWALRVRLCPRCVKTNLVEVDYWYFDLHVEGGPRENENLIICDIIVPSRDATRSREVAFAPERDRIRAHLATLTEKEPRDAYIEEQRNRKDGILKHVSLCERWFESQRFDRSQELEDQRKARKAAIIERLTELGWGKEIAAIPSYDELGTLKTVRQPTRLTDRIWKNIQPEMVEYMEKMKTNRLERERQQLIVRRKLPAINILRDYKISHLPWSELMPEPIDFCNFPEIRAVLELPNEVDVQESTFDDVIPLLPTLLADWAQGIQAKMTKVAQHVPKSSHVSSSPDSSDDPNENSENSAIMNLATTVFRCNDCYSSWWWPGVEESDSTSSSEDDNDLMSPLASNYSELLFYPKVMGHRCLTHAIDFPWNNSDPSVVLDSDLLIRRQWSKTCLTVDKTAGTSMADMIKTCGLDPIITTVHDMDELDPLLGCPMCATWADFSVPNAEVKVFGWRAALMHRVRNHPYAGKSWLVLTETQKAVAQEARRHLKLDKWVCTHCLDRSSERKYNNMRTLKKHLLDAHEVSDPTLNVDYHKSFDAPDDNRGLQVSMVSMELEKPSINLYGLAWEMFGHDFGHDYDSEDSDDSEAGLYFGW